MIKKRKKILRDKKEKSKAKKKSKKKRKVTVKKGRMYGRKLSGWEAGEHRSCDGGGGYIKKNPKSSQT